MPPCHCICSSMQCWWLAAYLRVLWGKSLASALFHPILLGAVCARMCFVACSARRGPRAPRMGRIQVPVQSLRVDTKLTCGACSGRTMFSLLAMTMLDDVNTINTWAEPHNANGVTPNTVIDSNDEPPKNNQQRMTARGY